MLLTEDIAHQFAEAVDDGGMIDELRRRLDQPEGLHQPGDLVEAAAMLLERGENGEPSLPRRLIPGRYVEIGADASLGQTPIGPQWSVAREVEQTIDLDDRLINADPLSCRP